MAMILEIQTMISGGFKISRRERALHSNSPLVAIAPVAQSVHLGRRQINCRWPFSFLPIA
jgi:hypothetical protein